MYAFVSACFVARLSITLSSLIFAAKCNTGDKDGMDSSNSTDCGEASPAPIAIMWTYLDSYIEGLCEFRRHCNAQLLKKHMPTLTIKKVTDHKFLRGCTRTKT